MGVHRFAMIVWLAAVGSVAAAGPPAQVSVAIHDGRVWLSSRQATLNEILAEYTRAGGTEFVNTESLGGAPLTLELTGVPERQALAVLLRGAGGFVTVPRGAGAGARVADTSAASEFAKILVVPASAPADVVRAADATAAAPAPEPPPPPEPGGVVQIAPGVRRLVGADGRPIADDQDVVPGVAPPPPTGSMPPGFSTPSPAPAPPPDAPEPPSATPTAPPGAPAPGLMVPVPGQPGAPAPAPKRPGGRGQR